MRVDRSAHPSDEQLLCFADSEFPPHLSASLKMHLLDCKACQSRIEKLRATMADFIQLRETQVEAKTDSHDLTRFALRARLLKEKQASLTLSTVSILRHLASASVAVAIVTASVWMIHGLAWLPARPNPYDETARALPERRLTPGVVRTTRAADTCNEDDLENDPPVNSSLEETVFREYNLPESSRERYEVDYLISPTLGGTGDLGNLWPQPHSATPWNARVKDALEDHLHALVCQGKLPLQAAQQEIATDWIAAYKQNFHTETPLSTESEARLPASGARHLAGIKPAA